MITTGAHICRTVNDFKGSLYHGIPFVLVELGTPEKPWDLLLEEFFDAAIPACLKIRFLADNSAGLTREKLFSTLGSLDFFSSYQSVNQSSPAGEKESWFIDFELIGRIPDRKACVVSTP